MWAGENFPSEAAHEAHTWIMRHVVTGPRRRDYRICSAWVQFWWTEWWHAWWIILQRICWKKQEACNVVNVKERQRCAALNLFRMTWTATDLLCMIMIWDLFFLLIVENKHLDDDVPYLVRKEGFISWWDLIIHLHLFWWSSGGGGLGGEIISPFVISSIKFCQAIVQRNLSYAMVFVKIHTSEVGIAKVGIGQYPESNMFRNPEYILKWTN